MLNSRTLCENLVCRRSISPDDAGCQHFLSEILEPLGFKCEYIHANGVTNLWARRGTSLPLVVFAGHTDVVPPGPIETWDSDPFNPTERNGKLFGRGCADMKSSLAAFICAIERHVTTSSYFKGSIGLMLTSDEEGPATSGTKLIVEMLQKRGETIDFCIIGEPTSEKTLGDTIKNGRRGSLSGHLTVRGIQGHIAYPHLARNPIHDVSPALTELTQTCWDKGNDYFSATSFQISNIHAGTGANNVIPGAVEIDFNFRFSPSSTPESLQLKTESILKKNNLSYSLEWTLSGRSFLTHEGYLTKTVKTAIQKITGIEPQLSTTGGTSDGRFIVDICSELVEFGPINASIHKINEHIDILDLERLTNIYTLILKMLLEE